MRSWILTLLTFVITLQAGEKKPVIIEDEPPVEIPALKPGTKIRGKNVRAWIEHLSKHESETERKLAMLSLIDFGPAAADAVPDLRTILKDELQEESRRWAAETLAAIGPAAAAAAPDLSAIVANAKMPANFRAAACAAVAQIAPDSATVRKAIIAAMRDAAVEVRIAAVEGAALLPLSDKNVVAGLNAALSSPETASAAATSLRCMGDEGVNVLATAVERGNEPARVAAAEALGSGKVGGGNALGALLKALKRERDQKIRAAILSGATKIAPKDPAVLTLVAERLAAGEPTLQPKEDEEKDHAPRYDYETQLFYKAGNAALDPLRLMLHGKAPAGRSLAVGILSKWPRPNSEIIDELVARAQDREPNVRAAAIKALDSLGPVAMSAKDALLEIAKQDPASRRAAEIAALNVSRDPEKPRVRSPLEKRNTDDLLKLLKDQNVDNRVDAADALRARTDEPALIANALIDALNDPDDRVKVAAAQSLIAFGKYARVAVSTFIQWIEAYAQEESKAPTTAPTPGGAERDGLAIPKAAVTALAGMGADAKAAMPAVIQLAVSPIIDRDKQLQTRVGLVLKIIGPDAAPLLSEKMKENKPEIKIRAARAIAAMGLVGATAIPDLIDLSKNAVDDVSRAGFLALQAMGPPAYDIAAPYLSSVILTDLFADRRKWAAHAMGDIGVPASGDTKRVIDGLQAALLDADESVCRAAHAALVKIGSPALPRLRELLKLGEGQASYWWAVRVMAQLRADPDDVIPRLIELTQPDVESVKQGAFAERGTAAELLGEYAPAHKEIIPPLLRVLGDREEYVAHAAMRSLARFGDSIEPTLQALTRHRNPMIRKRALQAFEFVRLRTMQAVNDAEK